MWPFNDKLDAFKRNVFGARPDDPIILHRADIVSRRKAFGVLRDSSIKAKFNSGLLDVLREAKFVMCCVVIDKKTHGERYTSPLHPYHYCLAGLLDRYSGWLNWMSACGDVMAESRGGKEDMQLKAAYRTVYESGTIMFQKDHHQKALASKEIKLKGKSVNIAGLQLSDMLAHPLKQDCLIEKGYIADCGDTFAKEIVSAVSDKWNRNDFRGKTWGYGKVML